MEQIRRLLGSSVLDEKQGRLKRNFQDLESRKEDIEDQLKHVESSSSRKTRSQVQNWLTNVESTKRKVEELEEKVQVSSKWKRFRLETSVDKLTKEVTELADEHTKFPSDLTIESYEKEGVALLTKRLVGEAFHRNKNMLLDCLINGDDPIIGVYGMGGVGKTTLLMHIHNRLLEHGLNVSWVTVSQDFTIYKLQCDIARIVRLVFSEEDDVMKRAAKLASALKRKSNFVLILDDVWEHICVENVGIPVGESGFKLVLTTRSLIVCQMINCQKAIKVEPLLEEEAWTLFTKTFGNETPLTHQITEISKSLVKECNGLPLGIIVMARSMIGVDDIHEWRNALEEIRGAEYQNGDMEFYEVFRVLKYSYDRLKDLKLQECLLYCSLFPEDKMIGRDELIEYFIVEKLIDEKKHRKSELDKGHVLLNKLEKLCLLEGHINEDGRKCVKMHDLVRDMAIKIANVSRRYLVQAGKRLREIPNKEKWSQDLLRVSLMSNEISNIHFASEPPKCPRLSTLLLSHNDLRVIPNNFFMHMNSLGVLDLSYTRIERLPTSTSDLKSLTALLLIECLELRYLPSLENLTALRKLDLSYTSLEEVPKGMEKLVNLRYLGFDCFGKMIPDGILSQLSFLQYFLSCSLLGLRGKEIGSLRNLETFTGLFHHISDMNMCVRSWDNCQPGKYLIAVSTDYEIWENISLFFRENITYKKKVYLNVIESEVEGDPAVFSHKHSVPIT